MIGMPRPPAWLQDEVRERDGHRCSFLENGKRCMLTGKIVQRVLDLSFHDDPGVYKLFCEAHAAIFRAGKKLGLLNSEWGHA